MTPSAPHWEVGLWEGRAPVTPGAPTPTAGEDIAEKGPQAGTRPSPQTPGLQAPNLGLPASRAQGDRHLPVVGAAPTRRRW